MQPASKYSGSHLEAGSTNLSGRALDAPKARQHQKEKQRTRQKSWTIHVPHIFIRDNSPRGAPLHIVRWLGKTSSVDYTVIYPSTRITYDRGGTREVRGKRRTTFMAHRRHPRGSAACAMTAMLCCAPQINNGCKRPTQWPSALDGVLRSGCSVHARRRAVQMD